VLDTRTQLMWMTQDIRNLEGRLPRNVAEALAWVNLMNQLRYAGFNDWRVPTLEEYQSIYDKRRRGRSYRNARVGYPPVFENGGGEYYWVFEAEKTDHWLNMHPHVITFRYQPFELENAEQGEDDPGNSVRLVRTTIPTPQPPPAAPSELLKTSRMAILKSHDLAPFNLAWAGFNATCQAPPEPADTFDLQGDVNQAAGIIARIQSGPYALVVAIGPLAAQVASTTLHDIPVIIVMTPRFQQHGWTGNNISGIALHISPATQFATYKTLLPGLRTVGIIYNPAHTGAIVAQARTAAAQLGLQLVAKPVALAKEVPDSLRSLLGKIDALWMIPDETVATREALKFFTLTTVAQRVPFLVMAKVFVEVGALAGVSSDYTDIGRQACQLAKDITSGRLRPAEIGVQQPDKASLAINLRVARQLGLQIPSALIETADNVFR
jgi:putative ABC transport system substrate-binding protein